MSYMVPPGMTPKEYWGFLKEKRKKMAAFYEENPQVTVQEVMAQFRVSRYWVEKALEENGVSVDRSRNRIEKGGFHYEQRVCSHCGEKYRHYCDEKKVKAQEKKAPRPKKRSSTPLEDLPQELDHLPLLDEDWAWTNERIEQMYQDDLSPQEIHERLKGNSTPYPSKARLLRDEGLASPQWRYTEQFLKSWSDYPQGVPPAQLLD